MYKEKEVTNSGSLVQAEALLGFCEQVFQRLGCWDKTDEGRELEYVCGQAMIEAGVERDWVRADYDNVGELLSGQLGPLPR